MTRLIPPDLVEQACIDLLANRHREHLAALERQLELDAETIERFATVDLLQDEETLPEQSVPAARLAITGLADEPDQHRGPDGRTVLVMPWRLELDVLCAGQGYSDAMQRIRWMALTACECLLQRLPRRSDPVESLRLTACDFEIVAGSGSSLGRAELAFAVVVPDALTVIGGLPVDDADQPPAGGPGGAPDPPYSEPEPWPAGLDIDLDIDRTSLTEET